MVNRSLIATPNIDWNWCIVISCHVDGDLLCSILIQWCPEVGLLREPEFERVLISSFVKRAGVRQGPGSIRGVWICILSAYLSRGHARGHPWERRVTSQEQHPSPSIAARRRGDHAHGPSSIMSGRKLLPWATLPWAAQLSCKQEGQKGSWTRLAAHFTIDWHLYIACHTFLYLLS